MCLIFIKICKWVFGEFSNIWIHSTMSETVHNCFFFDCLLSLLHHCMAGTMLTDFVISEAVCKKPSICERVGETRSIWYWTLKFLMVPVSNGWRHEVVFFGGKIALMCENFLEGASWHYPESVPLSSSVGLAFNWSWSEHQTWYHNSSKLNHLSMGHQEDSSCPWGLWSAFERLLFLSQLAFPSLWQHWL